MIFVLVLTHILILMLFGCQQVRGTAIGKTTMPSFRDVIADWRRLNMATRTRLARQKDGALNYLMSNVVVIFAIYRLLFDMG